MFVILKIPADISPAASIERSRKSCTDEILWIWQKKSNNIHELNSHIWDEWADETGSIGKAYGYQMGVKHQYKEGRMDQVDRVIYDLKHNPFSRRIMTNLYVHQDLSPQFLSTAAIKFISASCSYTATGISSICGPVT